MAIAIAICRCRCEALMRRGAVAEHADVERGLWERVLLREQRDLLHADVLFFI